MAGGNLDLERRVRLAAFDFLEAQTARHGEVLEWSLLTRGFAFEGTIIPLLGASGIWKPGVLSMPISITTAPPDPRRPTPYEDGVGADGLLRYRYQGVDPQNHFNRGLRDVYRNRLPLIYFLGTDKGRYRPFWPAFIERDDAPSLSVYVELHDAAVTGVDLTEVDLAQSEPDLDRAYARRLTLQRLHQAAFRDRVLRAYRRSCAVCQLKHTELLDAAHIVGDRDPRGLPVVPNGLALCKIHHAAFDSHILGIRPDHVIEIREDILQEVDGPMLRFGLQAVHGQALVLPSRKSDQPDPERLEVRYEQFRRAG